MDKIIIGEKSYNIEHIHSKNIRYVNAVYLINDKISGHIEERNGNKYLMLISISEGKDVLKKYKEVWGGTKGQITLITNASDDYYEEYIEIKINSDDDLLLNKILNFCNLIIVVRSVFEEDYKYYLQFFLDECLYEL